MTGIANSFSARKFELIKALIEHMQISFTALILSLAIAIPLGIILTKNKRLAEPIIGMTSILQTIPSLALLGLLIPLLGIGRVPAIIALVVYSLLPILRNTYTGINGIDPSLIEAATALGMNSMRRLMKVELPLAMPVIMAGIRTATVLIIGTATLAALIGAGGLGDIILLGLDRNDANLIILGAVPAAALAIFFDVMLRKLEKFPFRRVMYISSILFSVSMLMLVLPYITIKKEEKIVIAGKLGSEPEILINMYQFLIEGETEIEVELKPGLGKTSFIFNALKTGEIDIYPEFTGTAINEFLKTNAISTNSQEVYLQARKGMAEKYKMELLEPMQYNNTYTLAVPDSMAKRYGLKTISDLKKIQKIMKPGFTLEFNDRQDGYQGIRKLYGIDFLSVTTMEPKLRYPAIKSGDINVVDAYSTDSELEEYHLTSLEDDKGLFPPYQGAPLLRKETLEKYPEIKPALEKLSGKISDREMRAMNYRVNVEGKRPVEVAKEYLEKEGLIK
ncbi:ABC transporter permease/substrate-binding protein [Bacillus massilinigeriensis]|uniref:ABC transporter permease/substrate-binding protein n=1 Tax=Bacillus mediterraneensis TaxID=1805474 RepID=UPI0008F95553|nr:ABC transporter permease/substrate-binding protein [Bacillus mediterraneensis]